MVEQRRRAVTLHVDERRWRGLVGEARLLAQVFGMPFTPEGVLQAHLDRALGTYQREEEG